MEFTKLKTYLEQLNTQIQWESTGTPEEFAKKLGVSERTLQNHLQQLRELGIEIIYDYNRKTYKYPQKGGITFNFTLEDLSQNKDDNALVFNKVSIDCQFSSLQFSNYLTQAVEQE